MILDVADRQRMTAEDFELVSRDKRQILLPFHGKLWGELLYRILDRALSSIELDVVEQATVDWMFEEVVLSTKVCVSWNIQREVRAVVYVDAELYDSRKANYTFPCAIDRSEAISVLDAFFARGSGLTPAIRSYYYKLYSRWRDAD